MTSTPPEASTKARVLVTTRRTDYKYIKIIKEMKTMKIWRIAFAMLAVFFVLQNPI